MELYHNNMSVCAQKVRLVLAEKGLKPVEHAMLLRNGDTHTPEYLKLNPKGVVPTLVDKGSVIVESTIICEYLEDAYPETSMRPADPVTRARMREWTQLPDASLHRACGQLSVAIAWRHQILAAGGAQLRNRSGADAVSPEMLEIIERGVEAAAVPSALAVYDRAIGAMAATLRNSQWLAGDQYSLADAAMLPYVLRLSHLSLDWMWEGDRQVIGRWLGEAQSRPNYSAIADYLDAAYVHLASEKGAEVSPQLKGWLGRAA